MERVPSAHVRISEMLGREPRDARTPDAWWQTWSAQTDPALPLGFLLAGREEARAALADELTKPPQVITAIASSKTEALAFLCASLVNGASNSTDYGPRPSSSPAGRVGSARGLRLTARAHAHVRGGRRRDCSEPRASRGGPGLARRPAPRRPRGHPATGPPVRRGGAARRAPRPRPRPGREVRGAREPKPHLLPPNVPFHPDKWGLIATALSQQALDSGRISRGDGFAAAARPADADANWQLFCTSFVFGYGTYGVGPARLERILKGTPPVDRCEVIAEARRRLRRCGPLSAYGYLRGDDIRGKVPH